MSPRSIHALVVMLTGDLLKHSDASNLCCVFNTRWKTIVKHADSLPVTLPRNRQVEDPPGGPGIIMDMCDFGRVNFSHKQKNCFEPNPRGTIHGGAPRAGNNGNHPHQPSHGAGNSGNHPHQPSHGRAHGHTAVRGQPESRGRSSRAASLGRRSRAASLVRPVRSSSSHAGSLGRHDRSSSKEIYKFPRMFIREHHGRASEAQPMSEGQPGPIEDKGQPHAVHAIRREAGPFDEPLREETNFNHLF
jgi:hypothetical protein